MLTYSVVINVRRPENLLSLAGVAALLLFSWLVSYDRRNVRRINVCVHIKDPVVHVRVRWIMETLSWVARLCCVWLPQGKATRISRGIRINPNGTMQL